MLFRTNKGELSVQVRELRLLSKSLRPLPDKFHGLADQELKYRQRYVDLIMNPEAEIPIPWCGEMEADGVVGIAIDLIDRERGAPSAGACRGRIALASILRCDDAG